MSFREHVDRLWPSLVALAGTVAVVLGLLYLFGDDSGDGSDATADQGDSAVNTASPESSASTSAESPDDDEVDDEPGDEPGDDDGSDTADEPTDEPTESGPVTAPPELQGDIGVLNSTSVAGLAAGAEERFEAGGWVVVGVADYTGGDVAETTIFYPADDMRESAEAFAAQFPEIVAVEPTPAESNLNRNHPVVILAQDYADAMGEE